MRRRSVSSSQYALNVGQMQLVLIEDRQPSLHQLVVVRLVTRGHPQGGDAGALSYVDPNLGDQHAFEIKTCQHALVVNNIAQRSPPLARRAQPKDHG